MLSAPRPSLCLLKSFCAVLELCEFERALPPSNSPQLCIYSISATLIIRLIKAPAPFLLPSLFLFLWTSCPLHSAFRYQTSSGFGFSATLGVYDNATGVDVATGACETRVGWKLSSLAGGFRAGCACDNGPAGLLCKANLGGSGQSQWLQVIYWLGI